MNAQAPRRSLMRAVTRAIEGGRHIVDIDPATGRVRILPIGSDLAQADDAALDAEIREHMGQGDGRP